MKKMSDQAVIPTKGTPGSISYDVQAITTHTIQPGHIMKVPTGLAVCMPEHMYLRIAPRSSLALKHISVEGVLWTVILEAKYKFYLKITVINPTPSSQPTELPNLYLKKLHHLVLK